MRLGYCGGDARWSTEADFDGDTPDDVVNAVLLVEGLDRQQSTLISAQILTVVVDWLFDLNGRGERSRLPR